VEAVLWSGFLADSFPAVLCPLSLDSGSLRQMESSFLGSTVCDHSLENRDGRVCLVCDKRLWTLPVGVRLIGSDGGFVSTDLSDFIHYAIRSTLQRSDQQLVG